MRGRAFHVARVVLSPRERQLLTLFRSGQTRREIAATLGISVSAAAGQLKTALEQEEAARGIGIDPWAESA